MRGIWLTVFTTPFVAAGCHSSLGFLPEEREIAKLERRLDGHRCVGDLRNWQAAYVRKRTLSDEKPMMFDRRMIEFTLRKADGKTVIAGRKSAKRYEDWDAAAASCSEPDCLFGGYIVPSNELILECEAPPAS